MKIKLVSPGGTLLRSLTTEGGELHRAPEAIVFTSDEPGVIYGLTQRDDPDGAQVYTRLSSVLVLDR